MVDKVKDIVIVGAGIAGLTSALCLKKCGLSPNIIEKSKELTTQGAGIQITPNAFKVLDQLNLKEKLLELGHLPSSLNIYDYRKKAPLLSANIQEAIRDKAPYLVIKRQDLLNCLFNEIQEQNIPVKFNQSFSKESYISPPFNNAPLIGADGVWSSVRETINQQKAHFSGRIAFRAMIQAKNLPEWVNKDSLSMIMAPNAHLVFYPVDKSKTFNFVFIVSQKRCENAWSSPASIQDIMPYMKAWPTHVTDFMSEIQNWKKWPLFGVNPQKSWYQENKVLIGDAAHAMVPFLAQGGAMAIEDAAVLAQTIIKAPSSAQAFKNFETIRKQRVSHVWHEAFENGKRYHWQGFMAKSRNIALQLLGGKKLLNRYDWIYDWQPPKL